MTTDLTGIGYAGKILRVDLTAGSSSPEDLTLDTVKKWVGGVGLAAKVLYEEVPQGVEWDDPENRLIWTTGPLAGTDVPGAATINIAAKGPMTHLAGASQANGYFGAYLKFSGYDGIVFTGKSPALTYLVVRDGKATMHDAGHLAGMDVNQTERQIRSDLGAKKTEVSIFAIGPAGEHGVRFACITGDEGHVAGHNGLGAVMGSKNLKAVVAYRAKPAFGVFDPPSLKEKAKAMLAYAKTRSGGQYDLWGTGGSFSRIHNDGSLPVRNYTTNLYPEHERMNGQYMRTHFKVRSKPCYRCGLAHVKEVTVTEGPYSGFVGEEPEYEQLAAWGPQIGNTDLGAVVMLANEVDRLGIDCNEASWVVGWAMECYEKGILTIDQTDGLDLTWGNVESVKTLLNRIARKEGCIGKWLAEGVMRASQAAGGEAADWAVYTLKGAAPRGHDHRGKFRWSELMDTCLSNTGTIEATWAGVHPELVDMEPVKDPFSHEEVSTLNARYNGIRQFDDCVGTCRLVSPAPKMVLECFNAVTGWNWTLEDAFTLGQRIVNQLRMFNIRHGLNKDLERPSARYGSVPLDGPAQGRDIMRKWDWMVENYYTQMGWDPKTGIPTTETLKRLGLEEAAKDL
ncbi:MAG: aldehyde ferredoxin oxidoreductase C-terminal domain-containing protein [Thermodesulfobacteriota bacterium]